MCDLVRHTRESYHTPVFMHVMSLVICSYSYSLQLWRHPQMPQRLPCNYRGAIAHGTPLSDDDQCALHVLQGPGTGDRSYLLVGTGASHVNYRHGADRCSVAGTGGGAGSLKILAGVLVHRATRPLRGSVSCGSGWSVPCVSIQLTLSQVLDTNDVGAPFMPLHQMHCVTGPQSVLR